MLEFMNRALSCQVPLYQQPLFVSRPLGAKENQTFNLFTLIFRFFPDLLGRQRRPPVVDVCGIEPVLVEVVVVGEGPLVGEEVGGDGKLGEEERQQLLLSSGNPKNKYRRQHSASIWKNIG